MIHAFHRGGDVASSACADADVVSGLPLVARMAPVHAGEGFVLAWAKCGHGPHSAPARLAATAHEEGPRLHLPRRIALGVYRHRR